MANIAIDAPGSSELFQGNEAIARGALEGGISVATGYPGTPSSDIIEALANVAKETGISAEWSINEKVALEAAAAASFAGLRSMAVMKQNGLSVALDFASELSISGIKAGMVLVVADDPGGISSTNEQDSRWIARMIDFPLLEPATAQEAKDMTKWALEISEEIADVVLLRSTTRVSHVRGNTSLGKLFKGERKAKFDIEKQFMVFPQVPQRHSIAHEKMEKARQLFEGSSFNRYDGPDSPDLLIATCGDCWVYSCEAVKLLGMENRVGIMKLGTTWPLPEAFIKQYLGKSAKVLVVEQIDPFLESNLKELSAELSPEMRVPKFYGKRSGEISSTGEINPDKVIQAITALLNLKYVARDDVYEEKAARLLKNMIPQRVLAFCPGCPHRASYWAINLAEKLDGREGFATGDIGCYTLAAGTSGYSVLRTQHCMGAGAGVGYGFGRLEQFGMEQPILGVMGDGTFYHSSMPAVLDAVVNKSKVTMVVLDNEGIAMTGFQPHPGIAFDAVGDPTIPASLEQICQAMGATVTVADPYNVKETTNKLLDLMRDEQHRTKVIIMKRKCALQEAKQGRAYNLSVDTEKCYGENCGCDKFCVRLFRCPGLIWDRESRKAKIDDAICMGCGVCAEICPHGAIIKEPNKRED